MNKLPSYPVPYGITMIDRDGNILYDMAQYDQCFILVINDYEAVRNIPRQYHVGISCPIPYKQFIRDKEYTCLLDMPDLWVDHSGIYFLDNADDDDGYAIWWWNEITHVIKTMGVAAARIKGWG